MSEQPMEQRTNPPTRFLRLPEVKARTGLARSTIYVRLDQGCFPRPVSLGSRAVGWIEGEVDEWIRERIDKSRVGDSQPRSWPSTASRGGTRTDSADPARSGPKRSG